MDLIFIKYLLNTYLLNTYYEPATSYKAWRYLATRYKSPEQNLGLHLISILLGEKEIPIKSVCTYVCVCVECERERERERGVQEYSKKGGGFADQN